jgi:four helix bundle protein
LARVTAFQAVGRGFESRLPLGIQFGVCKFIRLEKKMQFNFEKLIVWQKSMELVDLVYNLVKRFPKTETIILVPQLLRAANSVPANIAEGSYRQSKKEFIQFLYIAKGSVAETLTLLEVSYNRKYATKEEREEIRSLCKDILNLLSALIKSLSK